MALIFAHRNRGTSKSIVIYNGSGGVVVPGSNDQIRVRIGREGTLDSAPILTVSSDAPTAAGSSFTKNSPSDGTHHLRLDATDLDFAGGIYTLAVDYFDNADASEWKNVSRQVFNLEGA